VFASNYEITLLLLKTMKKADIQIRSAKQGS
jgi:hypothetical protein